MPIVLHSLAANHTNLLTNIRIAKETGYAGIEISGNKLKRYLAQGFTAEGLLPLLAEAPAMGLSYIQDIERQEPCEYEALLEESEALCSLAEQIRCPMI